MSLRDVALSTAKTHGHGHCCTFSKASADDCRLAFAPRPPGMAQTCGGAPPHEVFFSLAR